MLIRVTASCGAFWLVFEAGEGGATNFGLAIRTAEAARALDTTVFGLRAGRPKGWAALAVDYPQATTVTHKRYSPKDLRQSW